MGRLRIMTLLVGAIALLPGTPFARSTSGTIRVCRAAAGHGAPLLPLVIPAGSEFTESQPGGAVIRTIGPTNFAAKQQCAFAAAAIAAPAPDHHGLAQGTAFFPRAGDAGGLAAVVMQGLK